MLNGGASSQFNPHAPYIVGSEAVPIQESILTFNPFVYSSEQGHRFRVNPPGVGVSNDADVNQVYFYLDDFPQATARNRMFTANVYPQELLGKAGEIKSVVIPCSNVALKTAGTLRPTVAEVLYSNDTLAAIQAVADPSDVNSYLTVEGATTTGSIKYQFNFGVDKFRTLLNNKRILGVDILIDMKFTNGWKVLTATPNEFVGDAEIWMTTGSMYTADPEPGYVRYSTVADPYTTDSYTDLRRQRIRLGDICPIPVNSTGGWSAYSSNMRSWSYDSLARFATTTATNNEIWLLLYSQQGSNVYSWTITMNYLAMEVFYCEETRLLTGTRRLNGPFDPTTPWVLFQQGINMINIQDITRTTQQPGTAPSYELPPGGYALTINESNGGDAYTALAQPNGTAPLNRLRFLNTPLPTIDGIVNALPYPLDENVGAEAFTYERTDYIPQLAFGVSGGGPTDFISQVYGKQAQGWVFGNNTVEQGIDFTSKYILAIDQTSGQTVTRQYNWLRFYARTSGATTPLSVIWKETDTCIGSITAADFNALPALTTDGWREVNLQLSPSVTAIQNSTVTLSWMAPLERIGSRYEVLGSASPAVSGTAYAIRGGIDINPLPSALQPGPATYGGSTYSMKWMPQVGPYVTAPATDTTSDASVTLGIYQPPVSGFAVNVLTQPVTGIGEDCGISPCGIPTGIFYNHLSWNLPVNSGRALDLFDRTYPTSFTPPSPPSTNNQTFGTPTYGSDWVASTTTVTNSAGVSGGKGYLFPTTAASVTGGTFVTQTLPLSTGQGLSVSSSGTGYSYTPDAANLHITGNLSVAFYGRLNPWQGTGDQTIASRWETVGNQRSWRLYTNSSNQLVFEWSTDGTAAGVKSSRISLAKVASANTARNIQVVLTVNNGSGGYTVSYRSSSNFVWGSANWASVTWTQFASDVTTSGTTSVFAGTAQLEVGSRSSGASDRMNGAVYLVALESNGVLVRYADYHSQAAGTTTFTDGLGVAQWNVVANDAIVAGTTLVARMDATVTLGVENYQTIDDTLSTSTNLFYWEVFFGDIPSDLNDYALNFNSLFTETKRLFIVPSGTSNYTEGTNEWLLIASDNWNAGSWTYRTFPLNLDTYNFGSRIKVRIAFDDARFQVKVWNESDEEPLLWAVDDYMTPFHAPMQDSNFGIQFHNYRLVSPVVSVSDLELTPPTYWFGYYEIQRKDPVDTEWKTICKTTNPANVEFNDYEARTGVASTYRIRTVDVQGFTGSWSSEIVSTIPSPGVDGDAACLGDGAHIIIFTSNENQDGLHNLAYSEAWEGSVTEDLTFPEAGFVQLQNMYGKNFYTAFRPLERGGEQFSRDVLVQAAAISPAAMDAFNALTDMAWDDVNYVCVRDEDGNRWFASVTVPNGAVKNRRQLFMASVEVTEVTDTPTPVDAPWNP